MLDSRTTIPNTEENIENPGTCHLTRWHTLTISWLCFTNPWMGRCVPDHGNPPSWIHPVLGHVLQENTMGGEIIWDEFHPKSTKNGRFQELLVVLLGSIPGRSGVRTGPLSRRSGNPLHPAHLLSNTQRPIWAQCLPEPTTTSLINELLGTSWGMRHSPSDVVFGEMDIARV
eukprot:EG_transcript_12218